MKRTSCSPRGAHHSGRQCISHSALRAPSKHIYPGALDDLEDARHSLADRCSQPLALRLSVQRLRNQPLCSDRYSTWRDAARAQGTCGPTSPVCSLRLPRCSFVIMARRSGPQLTALGVTRCC
jgi:hypothetical protein